MERRLGTLGANLCALVLCALVCPSAHAGDRASGATQLSPLGASYHHLGGVCYGRGLRVENPYRLQTELGKGAESLSLTATYLDVQAGATFGGRGPLSHGLVLRGDFALDGIVQEVVTPSYLLLLRPSSRWALLGRA